jgi:predicted AAA+ superfamily ATPase
MTAFHTIAIPHDDILQGRLTMDVFAADLWDVFKDRGSEEYRNPEMFFKKTYQTEGLKNLLEVVKSRLEGQGGDPVLQLQTPFGGGKTHALIAMYHKAKEWNAKCVVIVGTAMSAKDTLWGQIEEQLTGNRKKYNDLTSPGRTDEFRELLSTQGSLMILLDELLEYVTKAAGVKVIESTLAAQTVAFLQELTELVSTLDRAVLVVTLPSSLMEHFDAQAEQLFQQLQRVSGRVEKIYTPVQENEIDQVIRRRLFSDVEKKAAGKEITTFMDYAARE